MRHIEHRNHRPGLTLIELAAGCACLGIVLAVVPPALVGARDRARSAQCLANLQRIATASLAYTSEDADETSIPVGGVWNNPAAYSPIRQRSYAYGGKSGIGGSFPAQMYVYSVYGWSWAMGSAHRPLNAVLYKNAFKSPTNRYDARDTRIDASVYRCPADDGFQGNHFQEWVYTTQNYNMSSYDHFGTSYNANLFWTATLGNNTPMRSNSPYLRPLSTVPNPGNTLLYMENVGRYCWAHHDPGASEYGGPFADILPEPEYPETMSGPEWHGEGWRFNAAFIDGHCASIRMKSYTLTTPYPADMGDWCSGSAGQTTGPCTYLIIRGQGWQIDTLPASPIQSDIYPPLDGRPSHEGGNLVGWPD